MTDALEPDTAWNQLHGEHEVAPKKYVPPFLQPAKLKQEDDRNFEISESARLDNIYSLEVDAQADGIKIEPSPAKPSSNQFESEIPQKEGGNLKDMRYIRMKIKTLKVEDNDALCKLNKDGFSIADGFFLTVSLPLADVNNNNVSDQFIKLNNYDVISGNEFEFTSLNLYNFRINEETFNELAQSNL
jgi:hypothetical protein